MTAPSSLNAAGASDATEGPSPASAVPGSAFHPDLHAGFAQPQKPFSPTPLWWWSGDRITADRLRHQLDSLAAAGVHNLVVINLAPNGPNRGALADDPPLFSEEWWGLWSELVQHASMLGTRLWFYDQLGFSSANLQGQLIVDHPEHAGAALDRLSADLQRGGTATLTCADIGRAIGATALELDVEGAPVGAPVPVPVHGDSVSWTAPDTSGTMAYRLSLIFSRPHGYDYLSQKACLALLDVVHGEFERRLGEHLGNTIAGSFQDEFPSVPTWSQDFADEFRRRTGYQLEPVITALFEDIPALPGERSPAQIRLDYQRVRASLAEEAFFRPLHDWHQRHGMLVGCDQQGEARAAEPLDTVRQYADYLRTHRWFSAPGSDHHGDAKVHSSLVHHAGGERVWIEAFHSSGWGSTLEETFDWLVPWLLAGATLYNPHAVYYSTRGGWFEWAPPSSCWRQPYWEHYRLFADTVSRLCWLLSRGRHLCSVGVFYPTATVQANTLIDEQLAGARRAQDCYLRLSGRLVWFRPELGVLPGAGTDFDVLDDDTVAESAVQGGQLITASEEYRVLVVPECSMLLTSTAAQLITFAESGGTVVLIGSLPQDSDSEAGRKSCQRLRDLVARGRVHHVHDADGVTAWLPSGDVEVGDGITLRRQVGDREILVVPAAPTGTATRQPPVNVGKSWRDHLDEHGYDFDPGRWRDTTRVTLPADACEVEQWGPYSGAAHPARCKGVPGGVEVKIDFGEAPLAVIVWRRGHRSATTDEAPDHTLGAATMIKLEDQWTSALVPTTDNTYGDLTWPGESGPMPVQQRRLEHLDPEVGTWGDVLVGQGTWAWRLGPLPRHEVPPPLQAGQVGPLHGPGWEPVDYSLSDGIEKDPMYVGTLGPNGRVPEEFWQIDHVEPGQAVVFRTRLPISRDRLDDISSSGAANLSLAVGANAAIEVWWNGSALRSGTDPDGYLRIFPLPRDTTEPVNTLEVIAHGTESGPMRGYWAVTLDEAGFIRPEWLSTPAEHRGAVVFRREVEVNQIVTSAVIQLATVGSATMTLNGELVATHGSYEPYGIRHRVQPYDVSAQLRTGTNVVEVRFDPDGSAALLVDALVILADGTRRILASDRSWTMVTEDGEAAASLERRRLVDPRFVQLFSRAHPLPRSHWLNDDAPIGDVLDLMPQASDPTRNSELRYRTVLPPGATSVRLPAVAGQVHARVDGAHCVLHNGVIELPHPATPGRRLDLLVRPDHGANAGAVWAGPLTYDCGEGMIMTGDWELQGLAGYAGGVTYRQHVVLPEHGSARLDLGRVRGTATVKINGHPVGTRIWSPYRVDLSTHSRTGANLVEVTVFNTLASYLDDASPTPMVYPGQRRAGLIGPVHIVTTPDFEPRSIHDQPTT